MHRKLSVRLTTALGGILFTLLALDTLVSWAFMLDTFADIESSQIEKDVHRVKRAVQHKLTRIDALARDWGEWDETYEYVADANPQFIASNLTNDTLSGMGIDTVAILDDNNQPLHLQAINAENDEDRPFPSDIGELLARATPTPNSREILSGLFISNEGPILISALATTDSALSAPSRGKLLVGRRFDSKLITEIQQLTQLPVDLSSAQAIHASNTDEQIIVKDADTLLAKHILFDLFGKPALVLTFEALRETYNHGLTVMYFYTFSMLCIGLALGAAGYLVLKVHLFNRLADLSRELAIVRSHGGAKYRLPISGNDEISELARDIADVIDKVEHANLNNAAPARRRRE